MLMNVTEGRVWAEIYLDHLVDNYHIIQRKAGSAKIMAAIKADAYGHGAIEVARALESEGIYMFGVASIEEGVELRESGISSRILVLSPIMHSQIDAIIEYTLIPSISEMGFYRILKKRAQHMRKPISVHVEVDTGMTRTGIPYKEAPTALNRMQRTPFIRIEGVFSHFPMADGNGTFTKEQIDKFSMLIARLRKAKKSRMLAHIANSSGVFRYKRSHLNLIRPGIALYGLTSSPAVRYEGGFKPVMALKSKVVNIRTVKAGTPISYGHTFVTKKRSRIATVSVGYGDGYPRSLSNIGDVLLKGCRAPIVGTICMDLIMIDVTNIKGVQVGDVVTLIGGDGRERISAEECAIKARTIVYEITSGIGPRVARVFKSRGHAICVRNLLGRWRYGV